MEQARVSQHLLDLVRMDRDADAGKGAFRAADAYADRSLVVLSLPSRRFGGRPLSTLYAQFHRLAVGNSLLHHVGPGQRERADVRLVGCIRPVALVFHLKYVSIHAASRRDRWSDVVLDGADVFEGLHGRDE